MRSGSNLRRFTSMMGFGAFDVSKLIKFYVKDALNEKHSVARNKNTIVSRETIQKTAFFAETGR